MVINHNIPALNTYRQLNVNGANTQRNLEKLSSGQRINKAADDAAGLAISEKMRAQIRGLDQASRNAQDGISMLQTAEGALNEAHSILQRMRELATQAASDTNVSVDRDEIQKELNQLTSEINRIGNTTEFNTQKLLDGGTVKTAVATGTKGLAVVQGAAEVTVNTSSKLEPLEAAITVTQDTESKLAVKGVYSLDITTAFGDGGTLTIDGGADTFIVNFENDDSGDVNIVANSTASSQAKAIVNFINGKTGAGEIGAKYTASYDAANPTRITLTQKTASATAVTAAAAGGVTSAVKTVKAGVEADQGKYTLTIDHAFKAGESVIVGGQTFTFGSGAGFDVDTSADDTAAEQINKLFTLFSANAALTDKFTITHVAGTSVSLEEKSGKETGSPMVAVAKPVQTAGDYDLEITKAFKAGEQITFGGQTFTAVASGANAANGQFAVGTGIEEQAKSLKEAVEAKLGTRFTVTLEDSKLHLVEKTAQATGEDLGITKTGNVQGAISYKQVNESSKGTAAGWSSGAFTALTNGQSGTLTFNGFTINLSAADDATTANDDSAATNKTATSMDISLDTADGATTDAGQAAKIAALLEANKSGTALADFSFTADGASLIITDKTEAGTGIATHGDDNNNLLIGASGSVSIESITNKGQLITAGKDAVKAQYSFDVTNAFKVNEAIEIGGMKFTGVTGNANALLGQFSVDGTKTEQAASLKKAIEANTSLAGKYDVAVSGSKITLTEKTAGQETAKLAAPTTELTKGTAGVYSFKAQIANEGQVYKIDGVSIKVVNDAEKYHDEIASGTAMLAAGNAKDQADNLRTAINLNGTLSDKYLAEGSDETVRLTQREGAESATAPVITVEKEGSDGKFVANFQIGANTGQSMTIEIGDIRSVALKVSGTESGISVSAKNGAEASYVAVANVSNGTDNTSVEYSLDVSDHIKASSAVSVIQDAIDAVSAQRSQMGAYENRLEHTINNLGTSSENLTAAESRIRDVDMAKEMMEFTKNNILSQAAQAMLAQANQQPQGVLQLLR